MSRIFDRYARRIAPLILAFGLAISPTLTTSARAQEEAAPGGEKAEGRPLDGYLGTTCLVLFALFVVGKSARR
ncbi:MAG: hypothetical protein ACLQGP_26780 [Isosphaeraceae bacterium]